MFTKIMSVIFNDAFVDYVLETFNLKMCIFTKLHVNSPLHTFLLFSKVLKGSQYYDIRMGVTCVLSVPIHEGKSAKQMVDIIYHKLEKLGAEKLPSWTMDCETYQSVHPGQENNLKLLHLLHHSEYPKLTFSVLENNTCMVSESGFDLIIDKLKAFYTPRKGGKIEVKGPKYRLGDIVVRIGSITQTSNFKGLILEIEYMPCHDAAICWNILSEFLTNHIDSSLAIPQPPSQYIDSRQGLFSEADTIVQYLPYLLQVKRQ